MDGDLEIWHLVIGAISSVLLVILFWLEKLSLWHQTIIATIRMVIQLSMLGFILDFMFSSKNAWWTFGFLAIMILVASNESVQRLKYRYPGFYQFAIPLLSLIFSALPYTILLVFIIFKPEPWHEPSIWLPIFGMILGNVMNTISLASNSFLSNLHGAIETIEQRLALGHKMADILRPMRSEAIRNAMLPVVNAMAVTGIVSLPGMMTGQILAGESPGQAVRYQILIWMGIAFGAGIACILALNLASRAVTDPRERPIQPRESKKV